MSALLQLDKDILYSLSLLRKADVGPKNGHLKMLYMNVIALHKLVKNSKPSDIYFKETWHNHFKQNISQK